MAGRSRKRRAKNKRGRKNPAPPPVTKPRSKAPKPASAIKSLFKTFFATPLVILAAFVSFACTIEGINVNATLFGMGEERAFTASGEPELRRRSRGPSTWTLNGRLWEGRPYLSDSLRVSLTYFNRPDPIPTTARAPLIEWDPRCLYLTCDEFDGPRIGVGRGSVFEAILYWLGVPLFWAITFFGARSWLRSWRRLFAYAGLSISARRRGRSPAPFSTVLDANSRVSTSRPRGAPKRRRRR
jgi:hypothetical protein